MVKIGWRKLAGWSLVYLLVVYCSAVIRYEIPDANVELLKWVTLYFFGANALEHMKESFSVKIGKGGGS